MGLSDYERTNITYGDSQPTTTPRYIIICIYMPLSLSPLNYFQVLSLSLLESVR